MSGRHQNEKVQDIDRIIENILYRDSIRDRVDSIRGFADREGKPLLKVVMDILDGLGIKPEDLQQAQSKSSATKA